MTSITPSDSVHASLTRLLSAENPETVLHLGCGVPLWLRSAPLLLRGKVVYRGYDEDKAMVQRAAVELPSLRFLEKDLDAVLTTADAVVVGPGIFRMCWGGASQVIANVRTMARSILAVATVPGADNATREEAITAPGMAVPLDVAACWDSRWPPSVVIQESGSGFGYLVWRAPFPWQEKN